MTSTNRRLFAAVLLAGSSTWLFSSAAIAQETDAPVNSANGQSSSSDVPGEQSPDPEATDSESITVTGTRIRRPGVAASIPVVSVSELDLREDAALNVQDSLRELPQVSFLGSTRTNSNFSPTNNGSAALDLRLLGPNRTLVLVNGRRFVSGFPGASAVDVNNIPTDFVQRVDIVTGGASAIYGSEAIAGVINFILKDNINGIIARAQGGITSRGDNPRYLLSLTGGTSWGADDRGHVTVNFTVDRDNGLLSRDRALSREDRFLLTVGPNAYSSFPPQGRFDLRTATGSAGLFTFDHDNNVVLGFSTPENGYNRNGDRRISLPVERVLGAANLSYELAPNITLFAEPTYSKVKSRAKLEPFAINDPFVYNNGGPGIPITNAFIPTEIQSLITAQNTDADPSNDIVAIQFRRRQNEVFDRSNIADRDTWRVATGARGSLLGDWAYELSYVYGHLRDFTQSADITAPNYRQALDSIVDPATGQVVCRDPEARASGCVPINIFGFDTASPQAAAYVTVPRSALINNKQHVVAANVTGSLLRLPAGNLGVALGAEYRTESSSTDWDENTNAGNGTGQSFSDLKGSFDVFETYAEADVPIFAGKPLANYLGLKGAIRYSKYSTVGGVLSWSAGGEYSPVKALRFRGIYAEANRAPNITELFASIVSSSGAGGLSDPCVGVTLTSSGPLDAACRAIPGLVAEITANGGAFTYSNFDFNQTTVTAGGNPNLKEETAKTLTLGVTATPPFLPGLSMGVDYFDIKVNKAIDQLPTGTLLSKCLESGDPVFCSLITRHPNGKLRTVNSQLVNISNLQTRGWDFNAGYGGRIGLLANDQFTANLNYTRLLKLKSRSFPGAPEDQLLGQLAFGGSYKNRANLRLGYTAGPVHVAWQVKYLGHIKDTLDFDPGTGAEADALRDINDVGAVFYHDVQVRLNATNQFEVYVGVDNVFDRDAPLIPNGFASSIGGLETAGPYDPFGRRFYAGVRAKF